MILYRHRCFIDANCPYVTQAQTEKGARRMMVRHADEHLAQVNRKLEESLSAQRRSDRQQAKLAREVAKSRRRSV